MSTVAEALRASTLVGCDPDAVGDRAACRCNVDSCPCKPALSSVRVLLSVLSLSVHVVPARARRCRRDLAPGTDSADKMSSPTTTTHRQAESHREAARLHRHAGSPTAAHSALRRRGRSVRRHRPGGCRRADALASVPARRITRLRSRLPHGRSAGRARESGEPRRRRTAVDGEAGDHGRAPMWRAPAEATQMTRGPDGECGDRYAIGSHPSGRAAKRARRAASRDAGRTRGGRRCRLPGYSRRAGQHRGAGARRGLHDHRLEREGNRRERQRDADLRRRGRERGDETRRTRTKSRARWMPTRRAPRAGESVEESRRS